MNRSARRVYGERVREAREARGLTVTALADLVRVSKQAISQYELDEAAPREPVMERLEEVLAVPQSFFSLPPDEPELSPFFYRSLASADSLLRKRGERRAGWFQKLTAFLREFVSFPVPNVPEFDLPMDLLALQREDIERAAQETRRAWGLGDGPITNVTWLIENNGVTIARDTFGTDGIDAFSFWSSRDGNPYVILGDDKGAAVRSRLDASHELGHLVLHRTVKSRDFYHRNNHKQYEEQAFAFATAFLLPRETFLAEVQSPSLDSLRLLKSRWLVSIGAMIFRLKHLGIIDDEQHRRLWRNMQRRGWRKKEPLDDELPVEQPRMLRRAMELVLSEGVLHPSDLFVEQRLSLADIAAFVGLDPDTMRALSDSSAPIQLRRPSKSPSKHFPRSLSDDQEKDNIS